MKGLNFLEGMNLTLQKPFVIRFLAKIKMKDWEMCWKIHSKSNVTSTCTHVHLRGPWIDDGTGWHLKGNQFTIFMTIFLHWIFVHFSPFSGKCSFNMNLEKIARENKFKIAITIMMWYLNQKKNIIWYIER